MKVLYIDTSSSFLYAGIVVNEVLVAECQKELEHDLAGAVNFVKTHRSCIVNLNNIKHIDFENNIIAFVNKEIDLLSRAHKKNLKERMKEI